MARKNKIQFSVEVVDKASKRLSRISADIVRFGKKMAVVGAGLATAFAFATKKAIGMADQLGKTAKVIGLSAESLQELRFAAQQTGVSAIGLDDSVRRMQRRFGEFINSGAGPAQKAIETLGISVVNTAGNFIGSEAAFFRTVDALQKVGGAAERSAILAQVFGDDFGPKLLPLLDKGTKGIKELTAQARELGLVIDNDSIAAAEKAQDAFGRLSALLTTKFIKAFADNAETIERMADALLSVAVNAGKAFKGIADFFAGGSLAEEIAKTANRIKELESTMGNPVGVFLYAEALESLRQKLADLLVQQDLAIGQSNFDRVTGIGDDGDATPSGPTRAAKDAAAELARVEAAVSRFNAQFSLEQSWIKARERVEEYVDSLDEVIEQQEAATEELSRTAQDVGLTFASAFEDAIVQGEGLRNVLQGLLDDLLRLAARKFITEPFTNFFGGLFESISGRASGGPVSRGTPYIVGERGPELFIPGASGSIAPNSALSGAAGGLQFVTKIDARGADPGLISRLPQVLEQRDRRLMIKVKEYVETGSVSL